MSTRYVALLRAVNVGGTGKLPMATLRALCAQCGFDDVRTYIASGNVMLRSALGPDAVQSRLARALGEHMGREVGVLVRTADEMAAVLRDNPFPESPGNRVLAIFLDAPPAQDAIDAARHRTHERIGLGSRELYVDYGDSIGASKLVIPAAHHGTARNMNTVACLVGMASD